MTNEGKTARKLQGGVSPDASSAQGAVQMCHVNDNVCKVLVVAEKLVSIGEKHLSIGEKTLDNTTENLAVAKENLTLTKESVELARQMTHDLREIMETQKKFHQKLDDMSRLYLGDRENTCPKFIFIGERNSSEWMKLKDAVSTKVKIHVHFFCEADFDSCRPHAVLNQQGIDISKMKDWFKKVAPWLRFSLAILYVAATTASNIAAPGVGLIIPNFAEWQQTSTLANGIVLATGYTSQKLDEMTKPDAFTKGIDTKAVTTKNKQELGIDTKAVTTKNKQELRGTNRKIITELLGNFTPTELEGKLGLRKVSLRYPDGSHRSVVWICDACFEKYHEKQLIQAELSN